MAGFERNRWPTLNWNGWQVCAGISGFYWTGKSGRIQWNTQADKHAHAMDFAPHPSEGADAIVVITPDSDYSLHRAQKTKRIIGGRMLSNERSVVDIADGAITHAPEAIVAPLEKGKPVKLFLRRYPGANDYYITAIFPADFPSESVK